MTIENGFIPVLDGLVDPALKIRLMQGSSSGQSAHDLLLWVMYDPQIRADRLTLKSSEPGGASFWALPKTEDADRQAIFSSSECERLLTYVGRWDVEGTAVVVKILNDTQMFRTSEAIIKRPSKEELSGLEKELQYYAVENFLRMNSLRKRAFSSQLAPDTTQSIICLREEVVSDYFGIDPTSFDQFEEGWRIISRREFDK